MVYRRLALLVCVMPVMVGALTALAEKGIERRARESRESK
jgi:hypothetical protein